MAKYYTLMLCTLNKRALFNYDNSRSYCEPSEIERHQYNKTFPQKLSNPEFLIKKP